MCFQASAKAMAAAKSGSGRREDPGQNLPAKAKATPAAAARKKKSTEAKPQTKPAVIPENYVFPAAGEVMWEESSLQVYFTDVCFVLSFVWPLSI